MGRILRMLVWALVLAGVVFSGCKKAGGEAVEDPNAAAASR